MSLSHALLGLLAVQPRTGYELTRVFAEDLGRYAWQAGHTSIYPELGRLAERGLVEVTAQGARGSRTYATTDAGRAELRSWVMDWSPDGKVRNEPVLRMFLLSALDPADALVVLGQIAEQSAAGATALRAVLDEAGPVVPRGVDGFGLLAAEFGRRQYEAVHEWARWAVVQLESHGRSSAAASARSASSAAEPHTSPGSPASASRTAVTDAPSSTPR